MLNKLEVVELILGTVLAIGGTASVVSGYTGVAVTGAHQLIKNITSNRILKSVREAMVEDKRHREDLQALLRQQGHILPYETIEFKAEMGLY